MFRNSVTLRRIKPSPTLAITAKAAELRKHGRSIIGLSQGEPDFDLPRHVADAAIEALRRGQTRYTTVDGTDELKMAVQEKFRRDNDLNFALTEITVNFGAKHTIMQALLATLDPGDEVVFQVPYWVSYPDIVSLAGGTSVVVPTSEENGFKMKPTDLAAAITERTRWVILNSPSNPTGAVYSAAELRALADVFMENRHVWILCDDIYEHIIFDGARFVTLAQVEPALRARTLTVNGTSKAYSMTGMRIGFGAGPPELIRAIATLQSQSTSNPCSIAQAAAVAALTGPQGFLAEHAATFAARRNLAMGRIAKIPGVRCFQPQGAFYLYINCNDLLGLHAPNGVQLKSDEDVVDYLLIDGGVATVPGSAFGHNAYFRISVACCLEVLDEACDRMRTAFGKLL